MLEPLPTWNHLNGRTIYYDNSISYHSITNRHGITHTNMKLCACLICNKLFSSIFITKSHDKAHTNMNYVYAYFATNRFLLFLIRSHMKKPIPTGNYVHVYFATNRFLLFLIRSHMINQYQQEIMGMLILQQIVFCVF